MAQDVGYQTDDIANVYFTLTSEPTTRVSIPVLLDDASEATLNGVSQIDIEQHQFELGTNYFNLWDEYTWSGVSLFFCGCAKKILLKIHVS